MFKAIIEFFQTPMPSGNAPLPFGPFHLTLLALSILTGVLLSVFFKNCSDKTYRRIVFISWLIILILEIYKQIDYSFHIQADGSIKFDYQWYAFPFQFCSSPLYVWRILAFVKNKHVYDATTAFSMTFTFFAGTAVMILGQDIYINEIGINLQTSIHHGLMLAIGALTVTRNRKRLGDYKFFLKGCIVFAILLVIAIILNSLSQYWTTETFNMFYVNKKFGCHLPVLSLVEPHVPQVVFLIIYLLGFMLVALIVHSLARGIYELVKLFIRIHKKRMQSKTAN